GAGAHRIVGPRGDVLGLLGAMVITGQVAAVAASVDDVRVLRVDRDVTAFAAADRMPVGAVDAGAAGPAGNVDGAVVLLSAVDVIGKLLVDDDVINLRRGLFLARPRLAAVEADGGAAVVAADHAQRMVGVDPQGVIVAVRHGHGGEGFATVHGF